MNICLIGGTGRSGTTILSKILSSHPDVVNVPEWRFLIDPDGIVDFYNASENWSPYHFDIRLQRLKKLLGDTAKSTLFNKVETTIHKYFLQKIACPYKLISSYSGVNIQLQSPNFNHYVDLLIQELSSFSFAGEWIGKDRGSKKLMYYQEKEKTEKKMIRSILRNFLLNIINDVIKKQGKKYYLEKNTWNILWFDKILEILPNAKLIHIYRDPRDVVASYSKQSWMPSNPKHSAIIYKDIIERWENIKLTIPNESYLELSLESLVDDTEKQLNCICDFWGIPWNNSLLNIDLTKSNSGRWKCDLSQQQQTEVNSVLNDVLNRLGYEH